MRAAVVLLLVGGFFIFPLTMLLLRASGHRATLDPANPLGQLGMQVAFVLLLCLPLVGAATLYRTSWFFPAMMIALGAHYLPFVFLYGMRMFAALCAVLVAAGLALGLASNAGTPVGGWLTGFALLAFALLGRALVSREAAASKS